MPTVGIQAAFRNRVALKVGSIDTPNLQPSEAALDLHIESGLTQYDQIRPQILVKEQTGDGSTRRFVLSDLLGATFEEGFSQITALHVVQNLDEDDERADDTMEWEIRQSATDGYVLFISSAVGTGSTIRIHYSTHHTIHASDANLTTVPNGDTDLLTCFAAMFTAYWIARKAGDLMITEMGVTEINLRRIREHWADRAKELATEAGEFMSPTLISSQSAGAAIQWPTESAVTGLRISHRDRHTE